MLHFKARFVACIASSLTAFFVVWGTFASNAFASSPGLPILVYHQIRDTADGPLDSLETISLEHFKSQMRYLHEMGYTTLSADEVVQYVLGSSPPGDKLVAIHFDDGWKSAQLALPILDMYRLKATFWIIAGKASVGLTWIGKNSSPFPTNRGMTFTPTA
jgi:hypothetical protein